MTSETLTEGNRPDPFGTRSFCGARLHFISGVYGPKPKGSLLQVLALMWRFQFNLYSPVWSLGCMLFSIQYQHFAFIFLVIVFRYVLQFKSSKLPHFWCYHVEILCTECGTYVLHSLVMILLYHN